MFCALHYQLSEYASVLPENRFQFKMLCVHRGFVDILDRDEYNRKSYISVSQNCGTSGCIAIYIQQ